MSTTPPPSSPSSFTLLDQNLRALLDSQGEQREIRAQQPSSPSPASDGAVAAAESEAADADADAEADAVAEAGV